MSGKFCIFSASYKSDLIYVVQIPCEVCLQTIRATMAAILASAASAIIQLTTIEEPEAINYTAVGAAVSTM